MGQGWQGCSACHLFSEPLEEKNASQSEIPWLLWALGPTSRANCNTRCGRSFGRSDGVLLPLRLRSKGHCYDPIRQVLLDSPTDHAFTSSDRQSFRPFGRSKERHVHSLGSTGGRQMNGLVFQTAQTCFYGASVKTFPIFPGLGPW